MDRMQPIRCTAKHKGVTPYARLRRLHKRIIGLFNLTKLRLGILRDRADPTGDVEGLYIRRLRADNDRLREEEIFIRIRSSYRRRKKKTYTYRHIRGIYVHELAHALGSMYHNRMFFRTQRKIAEAIRGIL